jgi:transcriptional regulator with XRE-family HTH domain
LVRKARELAGISAADLASRVGLTESEYFDVEAHPDEFIGVIAVAEAKLLCKELGLNIADVLACEPLELDLSLPLQSDHQTFPRSALLRLRREALGISVAELGFAIGFGDAAIAELETNDGYLDSLPIGVVAELAWKLRLPLISLIEPQPRPDER